ncbi:MAG: regulatory protein RecX [Candidatus Binatia bacterium]
MQRKTDGSKEEALKRALKFLSYRSRSVAEIRAKLTQCGFTHAITEAILQKLHSLNLLNDETFTRNWVRHRVADRGYGPLRIDRELRRKGISRSLIGQALKENLGEEESRERARRLVEKRFRDEDLGDARIFRRAVAFLQRRGYRDSVIAEVLQQPLNDN